MSLVLMGSTSGSVTLQEPAVAGSTVLNLPATTGTVGLTTSQIAMKNRIINGNMMIDQRNNGSSVTPANGAYTLDRWGAWQTASRFSIQRNAGSVTPPAGFTNYLGLTSLGAASLAASDYNFIWQPIEGFNTADLNWGSANAQTVTLSFWVRSSLTGTFGGAFINDAANRSYPFSYAVSAANTWEYKTITVPGDTTGTWVGATSSTGIGIRFGVGSGANFSGTAGAWAAGNIVQPSGSVSVVGTNGATFYITGVQLELGSAATTFDFRSIGTELALCQRYYEIGNMYAVSYNSSGAQIQRAALWYRVTKRAAASVTVSVASGSLTGPSVVLSGSVNGSWIGFGATSGGLEGTFNWTASIEL
jgi:hypothetical protein